MLNSNIYCHSYLTDWRDNINFITSYSSFKEDRGSVLLDLNNEMDVVLGFLKKIIKSTS